MLPFGVTIPATVPQRSEIPEGLMNYHLVDLHWNETLKKIQKKKCVTFMLVFAIVTVFYVTPNIYFQDI